MIFLLKPHKYRCFSLYVYIFCVNGKNVVSFYIYGFLIVFIVYLDGNQMDTFMILFMARLNGSKNQ